MKAAPPLLLVLMLAIPGEASADDVAAASKAFSRAQRAMLSGDYSRAADLFELADSLAPSAAALRSAVRARYSADHKAAAATHAAELLRRYPDQAESRRFAERLLDELGPSLARVTVACSSPCTLEVEGKAVSVAQRREHTFFVRPGEWEVVGTFDEGRRASEAIAATAAQALSVRLEEPPAPEEVEAQVTGASEQQRGGLPRHWAIGTGVVAVGLGVTATVFGVSTLRARDDIRTKVMMGERAAAEEAYDDARKTQRLTNVLIAGAAAAGVATVALAVFTDWSGSGRRVDVEPERGGGSVVYSGRF